MSLTISVSVPQLDKVCSKLDQAISILQTIANQGATVATSFTQLQTDFAKFQSDFAAFVTNVKGVIAALTSGTTVPADQLAALDQSVTQMDVTIAGISFPGSAPSPAPAAPASAPTT